jgi:hypothetical protein
MPVKPNDVIKVIAKFTQAGQVLLNVYELFHTGVDDLLDNIVFAAAGTWLEDIYDGLVATQTSELSYDTYQVINETQEYQLGEDDWPSLTVGSSAGEASPLQVAYLMRFPTNYLGSQGRKFIPGCNESALEDNGIVGTSTLANLATAAATIAAGFDVGANHFHPGVNNTEKGRFAGFQSAIVNDVVGSQRRRKQGVGV